MRWIVIGIAIAAPVIALAVVGGAFAYDEWVNEDQVGRNVTADGMALSGLHLEEAATVIAAHEEQLLTQPVPFLVDDEEVTLTGEEVGLEVDQEAIATAALAQRRTGGLWSTFTGWLYSWFTPVDIAVPITIDEALLDEVFDDWDRNVIDDPAYEGAVIIENDLPVPEYPKPGVRVHRGQAVPLILGSLEVLSPRTVDLPLTDLVPVVSNADVDEAVEKATRMVTHSVILTLDDSAGVVFSPPQLAAALTSEPVVNSTPQVMVGFDSAVLAAAIATRIDSFTTPAVDATFIFDEETKEFTIVPSQRAIVMDVDALGEAVEEAALGNGRGTIPTTEGPDAAFTTAMAEAMGPITEVSTFTTYHPCCASRVTNIHLIADAVDGAIVMPGEQFSINEHVGQRTLAKGYRRAGAIIQGALECCDNPANIGGGTSQFGTTFYNAVFFSCYDDIEHQPHSLYFPRYPFVREATLGYPKPDVIFLNDSDAIVYIDTSYTGGSITVTFYGNNGGRTCEAQRSGNTVTRIMRRADGSLIETESWSWFYRKPKPPTTTTTEPPDDSTTTTVPDGSTTTVPDGSTTTTVAPETTITAP